MRFKIYYHFQEVGRSANTAHLAPILLPNICDSIIYGDDERENTFLDSLWRSETDADSCVLYPAEGALNVSQWLQNSPSRIKSIVVIDGTYSQASRYLIS